jgi:DNA primase
VRRAADIVDVVSAYVSLKRSGRGLRGLCPFHSERTPSFHVMPEKQIFKCFGCGAGGDVFKFIQLREGLDFLQARELLASRAGIILDKAPASAQGEGPGKNDLESVNRWASDWFRRQLAGPGGAAARQYLASRGISTASVERFCIGFAPDSWDSLRLAAASRGMAPPLLEAAGLVKRRDDGGYYDAFRNRLIFPIHDPLGRTIAFGGRTLGEDPAKYINSPQSVLFDKSRALYGLSSAKDAFRERGRAVVVEGYIDCILAQQFGLGHTVATLGTSLTPEHVQLLRRYTDDVVVLFDADAAGQRAADAAIALFLSAQIEVRLAQVPEGKDPADSLLAQGSGPLEAALTSSIGALEFKWQQVVQRCHGDASGPDQRRAVEEFLGLILQSTGFGSSDALQRGLLINRVGKLLGLSSEEVQRQLTQMGRRRVPPPARVFGRRPARQANLAAAAMTELLEVLLNAPEYYASVEREFEPSLLVDREDAAIAGVVAELCRCSGGFALPELISRFESPETAARITELHQIGEDRGNHAATVEGAVAALQRHRERSRVAALMARLREERELHEAPCRPGDAGRVEPVAANEAARRLSHFAAPRHLATPSTVSAGPGASQAGA